jgi:hypothetical protein
LSHFICIILLRQLKAALTEFPGGAWGTDGEVADVVFVDVGVAGRAFVILLFCFHLNNMGEIIGVSIGGWRGKGVSSR